MKIGSLFSGIGGLELGLEWSGVGHTVWQVELNKEAQKTLAKHWPEAKRYEDVRHCSRDNLEPVDIICGGFPCTNLSSAGNREGLSGDSSSLWFEQLRIISELQPRWAVIENVRSGINAWYPTVCKGLEEQSYEILPVPLSASDVGAPHRRQRVFILAFNGNSDIQGESVVPLHGKDSPGLQKPSECISWDGPVNSLQLVDGVPKELALYGNAVVPQCAEVLGYIIRELEGMV